MFVIWGKITHNSNRERHLWVKARLTERPVEPATQSGHWSGRTLLFRANELNAPKPPLTSMRLLPFGSPQLNFTGVEPGPETGGCGRQNAKDLPLSSPEAFLESQSQFLLR
jgi:hypothetical protein